LGEPNDLENSEDRRSVGGHGNQHVRLRSAQIDGSRYDLPGSGGNLPLEPGRRLVHGSTTAAKSSNFLGVE